MDTKIPKYLILKWKITQKVQFGDNSRHNIYEEESKNINYKTIIDESVAKKKKQKKKILNNNCIFFTIVYVTLCLKNDIILV